MERLAKIGPGSISWPGAGEWPDARASTGGEAPVFKRAAVLGATGSVGRVLVAELMQRGVPTRVVSRSLANLRRNFAPGAVEFFEADMRDAGAVLGAAEGCDVLFLCVGVGLDRYEEHVAIARNTIQAMVRCRARCLAVSGYWSYSPVMEVPIKQGHPRRGGGNHATLRQIQEDMLVGAGAAVALMPDFFGPGASVSQMNDAIAALATGATVNWPGDPDALRDFLFMPDAGAPLVALATRAEAYGKLWNVAGCGPMQPRQLLRAAAERMGEPARVRGVPLWMVKLAARFNARLRGLVDIYPIYAAPAYMDASALRGLIGEYRVTPYPQAIERTVRWMTASAEAA